MDPSDLSDLLALQADPALRGHRVVPAFKVRKVTLELKAFLASRVIVDKMACPELLVQGERLVSASRVTKASQADLALLVSRDSPVQLVHEVQQESAGHRVFPVALALKGSLV